MTHHTEAAKNMLDASGLTVLLVTFAGWLPPIAAAFTIVVAAMRSYDWLEGRGWFKKRR